VSNPQQDHATRSGPTVSFGFNLGKIPGHGEDSDPILRDGPDLGLAGVFDGMGGAGGTVYDTPDGQRSGAYLASRIARDVVEQHLLAALAPDRPLPGPAAAAELQVALDSALKDALTGLNAPPSRLRSRLLRALPTTMAVGALQRTGQGGEQWSCHVLWAGDSRVYALTAEGMHQLSMDDLRDPGDAMTNLLQDSVISNAISADTEFHINHRKVTLTAPFLLITATDGCFGYLPSPMHFEEIILRTLVSATTEEDWSSALQAEIAAVTGDDAAMATIGVGADLATFQQLLADRLAEVTTAYTAPLDASLEEIEQVERQLTALKDVRAADVADRWRRYSSGYEQLMHPDTETDAESDQTDPLPSIWNPPRRISTGPLTPQAQDDEGRASAAPSSAEDTDATYGESR
jgi:serine/threonine protein phosphatase PrpC